MSLLTDALTKPDPKTDETAESAITELEEELDISGELDESSRDATVQAVAPWATPILCIGNSSAKFPSCSKFINSTFIAFLNKSIKFLSFIH